MNQSLHAIVWYLFIIWLPDLMHAMRVYLTSTQRMCKHVNQNSNGMLHIVSLTFHEAMWHMWMCCRDLLVWIDHSDVLLVPEECTRPL